MLENPLLHSIFAIFTGAAVLATIALYTKQSMLVSYILLGVILGPSGFKMIAKPETIYYFSDFGIIFLLFLMGLNLHPQNLWRMFKNATVVTLISSSVFAIVGASVGYFLGFNLTESVIIGAAMIFSSTIVGLKLLPTTVLHHQHVGEVVISVLLLQDLIAILVLLILNAASAGGITLLEMLKIVIGLPTLLTFTFLVERFVLVYLFRRFDKIQEYVFLVAIGWCLGIAMLAEVAGLSSSIGAFIAGVSIATNPIALYISESLKPLRDFFLILFFFSLGAGLDLSSMSEFIMPGLLLGFIMLLLKPFVFTILLKVTHESELLAQEVGFRIGQLSEFSLLVTYMALASNLIGHKAAFTIQSATIVTFILSTYIISLKFPTPISTSDSLRQN